MSMAQADQSTPALYCTRYLREDCKVGIVHVGYGAFHRSHQAVYIDDYMELTGDLRWGIAAVNLRSADALAFDQSSQVTDGYVLKTIDVDGTAELRQVRSHLKYVDWSSDPTIAENLLTDPDVHMISITVTESGYYLDNLGNLDLSQDLIAAELAGAVPQTIYGYLSHALRARMSTIALPISILCCDNIRSNGKMLEKNFLAYLSAMKEHDLVEWTKNHVSFPCSMVDRITPRATSELKDEVADIFGSIRFDPIHAESFSQWVLEKKFAGPMPDLSKTGAEIVDDVDPYEEAKIRILNGGHSGLAYLGALAGYSTFDQAMRDQKLRQHFDNFEKREVLPGLRLQLPFDKSEYLAKISARFCNAAIADQLERICMDGFSKMKLYIVPTVSSCFEQGIEPTHTVDSIASWYVFARRAKTGGMPIPYHEPYWDQLSPMLKVGSEKNFATSHALWGDIPKTYPNFASMLVTAIQRMEESWPA